MESPTRKVAAAGAAALLTVGLVVTGAGTASASAPVKAERITSAQQLSESIKLAAAQEQQSGTGGLSSAIGGRVASVDLPSISC